MTIRQQWPVTLATDQEAQTDSLDRLVYVLVAANATMKLTAVQVTSLQPKFSESSTCAEE